MHVDNSGGILSSASCPCTLLDFCFVLLSSLPTPELGIRPVLTCFEYLLCHLAFYLCQCHFSGCLVYMQLMVHQCGYISAINQALKQPNCCKSASAIIFAYVEVHR